MRHLRDAAQALSPAALAANYSAWLEDHVS